MPTRRGFFASLAALFVGARFWQLKPERPHLLDDQLSRYISEAEHAALEEMRRRYNYARTEFTAAEDLRRNDLVYLAGDGWRKS